MNDAISTPSQRPHTALVWIGRLIAAAMAFLFGMSGVMKLKGGSELAEGMLLTGYLGGAICTHWRVGDPFVVQAGLGILVWLSLFLRDKRLWKLIPFRSLK